MQQIGLLKDTLPGGELATDPLFLKSSNRSITVTT